MSKPIWEGEREQLESRQRVIQQGELNHSSFHRCCVTNRYNYRASPFRRRIIGNRLSYIILSHAYRAEGTLPGLIWQHIFPYQTPNTQKPIPFQVKFFVSCRFNFLVSSSVSSSPSLHSMPSSPTAKIVSPSRDSRGRGIGGALLLFCSAGAGEGFLSGEKLTLSVRDVDAPPLAAPREGLTARCSSLRACSSSSESESAILRISNPSSSWASCSGLSLVKLFSTTQEG